MKIRHILLSLTCLPGLAVASPAAVATPDCTPDWRGKYSGYVLKMHVPEDVRQYGYCNDYGRWNGTRYRGRHVPPGSYWVYKYPYWYVWRVRGDRIRRHGEPVYRIDLKAD